MALDEYQNVTIGQDDPMFAPGRERKKRLSDLLGDPNVHAFIQKDDENRAISSILQKSPKLQEQFVLEKLKGENRLAEQRQKTSIAGDAKLDDESAKNLAIESLYDSNATQGFRRDTKTMGQIMGHRTKIMKEAGISPQDVVSGRAGFKADTASLNKITPQYDAITAFENTAIRNGQILNQLVDAADTTGVPILEKWIRAGRKKTGDTDVSNFDAQINLYRAEVARILTQPNLSGVITDTARKEAEEFLSGSASAQQIKKLTTLLERDFHNRKSTLEDQISNIRSRMNKRVTPGGAEAPTPGMGAPVPTAAPVASPKGGYSDQGKERRYQEWLKTQAK